MTYGEQAGDTGAWMANLVYEDQVVSNDHDKHEHGKEDALVEVYEQT